MRIALILCFLALTACGAHDGVNLSSQSSDSSETYPKSPLLTITPGVLCSSPESYRYPEKVAYCGRHVTFEMKAVVFEQYEKKFAFSVSELGRSRFKIDHFIPLCMGGDNDLKNLWPQFETIYVHTDPIEERLCDLMAGGKVKQSEAIEIMRKAKLDPELADNTLEALEKR